MYTYRKDTHFSCCCYCTKKEENFSFLKYPSSCCSCFFIIIIIIIYIKDSVSILCFLWLLRYRWIFFGTRLCGNVIIWPFSESIQFFDKHLAIDESNRVPNDISLEGIVIHHSLLYLGKFNLTSYFPSIHTSVVYLTIHLEHIYLEHSMVSVF